MAAPGYSADLTVAQVLQQSSRDLSVVLRARKTACVGCALAGLCTLEDVSKVYAIPLEELLGELQRVAYPNHPSEVGVQNG